MQSLFSRESKEHTCKNPHGVPMVTSRATSPKSNLQRQIFTVECFSILLTFFALQLQLPFWQCTPGMFMFLSFIRYTTLISFPSSSCLIDLTLPTYHISRLDFFSSVEFALFS